MNQEIGKTPNKKQQKRLGFGIKMSLLTYFFVFISMIFSFILGVSFFKVTIEEITYKRLIESGEAKKNQFQSAFEEFINDFTAFAAHPQTKGMTENLKRGFYNFEKDNASYFQNLKVEPKNEIFEQFYTYNFLDGFPEDNPVNQNIIPDDELALVLQLFYVWDNDNPVGKRHRHKNPNEDESQYARSHSQYGNEFYNERIDLNVKDLYLVDVNTGRVFYSVDKNITFGTDLYTGVHRNSGLALAFKKAAASDGTKYVFEDFSNFIPAKNAPTAFVSIPITTASEKTAVLVAELDVDFFNNLMKERWRFEYPSEIEINIIGRDLKQRVTPISKYDLFKDNNESPNENFITPALQKDKLQSVSIEPYSYDLKGQLKKAPVNLITKDYQKNKCFLRIAPLNHIKDWYIITKINKKDAFRYINQLRWTMIIVYLVIIVFVILGVRAFRKRFLTKIKTLKKSMELLLKGESTQDLQAKSDDEIGSTFDLYNKLHHRIMNAADFASSLSTGQYKAEFTSNGENDRFALSFNNLKTTLIQQQEEQKVREEEDEKRKWINDGIAAFNDDLRQNNHDISILSDIIIQKLVNYVNAAQGGIFLLEGDAEEEQMLHLTASYAYDRKKFLEKKIHPGEGLIGNCYLEKKSIYLKNIPQDYMDIRSGLGQAKPKSLFLTPLMVDETVMGIIELASLYDFEPHQVEFLEKVTDNIAATFKTVRLNTKTNELLEISKKRASEISQQEEEMRQNLEEMQATQEELARLRKEDELRTNELQRKIENLSTFMSGVLNELDSEFYIKDEQGIIVYANKKFAASHKIDLEDLIGKHMDDLVSADMLTKEHESDEAANYEGSISWHEVETVKGVEVHYYISKRRVFIDTHQTSGIMYTRYTIS
ncbi:MAG: GAF domain-containing protein [Bacteroidales bacterium]|nr:GAF domain-containing protein [Bacteroidales bacterium]